MAFTNTHTRARTHTHSGRKGPVFITFHLCKIATDSAHKICPFCFTLVSLAFSPILMRVRFNFMEGNTEERAGITLEVQRIVKPV